MFLSKLFKKPEDSSKMENVESKQPVIVYVQNTPNPNAYKFISDHEVKTGGDAAYSDPALCDNDLARELLAVPGVEQIYFFDNVITTTLNPTVALNDIKDRIIAVIKDKLPTHDPKYQTDKDIKKATYEDLPEDLKHINEILDRTIRPGLQGDGGNIEILSYVDNQLSVRYQGACGSCPSSTMGTLQAINQILRDEFDPDIEVIPV